MYVHARTTLTQKYNHWKRKMKNVKGGTIT